MQVVQLVQLRRGPKDDLEELVVSNQASLNLPSSRRLWTRQLLQRAPMVLEEKPSSLTGERILSHIDVTVIVALTQTQHLVKHI